MAPRSGNNRVSLVEGLAQEHRYPRPRCCPSATQRVRERFWVPFGSAGPSARARQMLVFMGETARPEEAATIATAVGPGANATSQALASPPRLFVVLVTRSYVQEPLQIASCLGASWIAEEPLGTADLGARSLTDGGTLLVGGPYWVKVRASDDLARACHARGARSGRRSPSLSRASKPMGSTWYRWCSPAPTTGTSSCP